ncbi:MAG: hypothetical protein FIA94_06760 [Nitrospirae bacterium]|nr:hypothetical protein [Nitrospirota bacterium]
MNEQYPYKTASVAPANRRDHSFFIIVTILESLVLSTNFIAMLFMAFPIKSSVPLFELIRGVIIVMQVPLLPFILGCFICSLAFLFILKIIKNNSATTRILIKVHIFFVLYIVVMFTYWNVSASARYKNDIDKIRTDQKQWIDKTLPHFVFQNIKDDIHPLTGRDLIGKPSVLIFLHASHDPTKSINYRIAHDLYQMRNNLGAQLFIIANNTSKDLLRQHIQRFNIDLPLYYDPITNKKDNLGALNSYDDVLIVDPQGRLKSIIYKPQTIEEIKSSIAGTNWVPKQMNQQAPRRRRAKGGASGASLNGR